MRNRQTSDAAAASTPRRDPRRLLRSFLGNRRHLLVLGGLTLPVAAAGNWNWLVAIGAAPLLLSLLPCLAMCALGLCMNRMSGRSCSAERQPAPPMAQIDVSKAAAAAFEARANRHLDGSSGDQGAAVQIALEPQPQKRNMIDA